MTLARRAAPTPAGRRLGHAARGVRARWAVRRWSVAAAQPARVAAIALVACLAVVLVAWTADAGVVVWARELPPPVRAAGRLVTQLGDSLYIFVLAAIGVVAPLLLVGRRGATRARDAALTYLAGRSAFVFAAAAFSGLLAQLLKHVVGRARPRLFDEVGAFHFVLPGYPSVYASFPSGHTITAFACAAALGWFAPRWRWALLALAVVIGASRVVVGAHYPSDVLAGAAIGWLSSVVLRRAFAARGIVFRVVDGAIAPRGRGRIWPALRPRIG